MTTALFESVQDPDRTSERLTARALRRSLLPVEVDEATMELAALAGRRQLPILVALQRIDRSRTARRSIVLDRAEELLRAALQQATRDGTASAA